MATKIGLDQVGKPTPQWYKRLLTALIVIVYPAFGTFMASMPDSYISQSDKIVCGIVASFLLALVYAAKFIIGDDEEDIYPGKP